MLTTLSILSLDQGKNWREPAGERPADTPVEAVRTEAALAASRIRLSLLPLLRPFLPVRRA